MIKLSTILLLILFLNSCKTKIVCGQINSSKIKPLMIYDISFKFNRCRGRCFDLNEFKTIPISQCIGKSEFLPESELSENSINYPIEYCDELSGFTISDWALEVKPNIKKLDQIKKDNCN